MIEYKRGDTWPWIWTFTGITDYTGCVARQQIRLRRPSTLVADISTDDYINIQHETPSVTGIVSANFPYNMTAGIESGIYVTDLELTFPSGYRVSTDTLEFTVVGDVTHA